MSKEELALQLTLKAMSFTNASCIFTNDRLEKTPEKMSKNIVTCYNTIYKNLKISDSPKKDHFDAFNQNENNYEEIPII